MLNIFLDHYLFTLFFGLFVMFCFVYIIIHSSLPIILNFCSNLWKGPLRALSSWGSTCVIITCHRNLTSLRLNIFYHKELQGILNIKAKIRFIALHRKVFRQAMLTQRQPKTWKITSKVAFHGPDKSLQVGCTILEKRRSQDRPILGTLIA